jgi:glycosyltransferase involved in cell wall biosynthesis
MAPAVCAYTDSAEFGGAEEALRLLLIGLAERDWDVTLWHSGAAGLSPLLDAVDDARIPQRIVPPMPEGLRGAARIGRMARLLRQDRPDIFHAHLTWPFACKWALAAASAARTPVIVATAQLFGEVDLDASRRTQAWLLGRQFDRVIAVSQDTHDRLHRELGWPLERLTVIPNAVDVERYRDRGGADRSSLDDSTGRPVVLVPARLEPQKGHRYLLEAARELPGVRFACAGSGSLTAELTEIAERLGVADRVAFLGYRDDIADLLSGCDLVVLPSLDEGLPLALIEASAAGVPVVATDVGGTGELVVAEKTGLLVAPRDPRALAQAVARLIADPALARRLGAAGRQRARQHFSTDSMVEAVEGEYRRLLARPPARMVVA